MLVLCRQRHVDRLRLLVHLLHLLLLLVHLLRENGVGSRLLHRRLRQQLLVVRRSALRVARLAPHRAPPPRCLRQDVCLSVCCGVIPDEHDPILESGSQTIITKLLPPTFEQHISI